MIEFLLKLKITHPGWDAPVEQTDLLKASSRSKVLKALNLTNEQACEIRNYGIIAWVDHAGVSHELTLTTKEAI